MQAGQPEPHFGDSQCGPIGLAVASLPGQLGALFYYPVGKTRVGQHVSLAQQEQPQVAVGLRVPGLLAVAGGLEHEPEMRVGGRAR